MSDSLWSHRLQHTQLPCPSQSPRVFSDSCPLSWWCYLVISSSASLFFCLQYFVISGSFPMSQLFPSGGQSIGASASILLINLQCWFSLELNGLISLLSKELSKSLLQHNNSKAWIFQCSAFFMVQLSYPYMTTEKITAWLHRPLTAKWGLFFLILCLALS